MFVAIPRKLHNEDSLNEMHGLCILIVSRFDFENIVYCKMLMSSSIKMLRTLTQCVLDGRGGEGGREGGRERRSRRE